LDSFVNSEAISINNARMEALASIPINFEGKTVLEVGSGPGLLSDFFLRRGSLLTITDGRSELLNVAEEIHRGMATLSSVEQVNLEDISSLKSEIKSAKYEIVFAFGILYHLSNPQNVISELANLCSGVLLMETVVNSYADIGEIVVERLDFNQALKYGSRLSVMEYINCLKMQFENVYFPNQPVHVDFQNFTNGRFPARIFLVASKFRISGLKSCDELYWHNTL
jgi:2-polyprenyl-3-methyl-5-hydroxy-6-metoxy-1,4-benzoquinol methylase